MYDNIKGIMNISENDPDDTSLDLMTSGDNQVINTVSKLCMNVMSYKMQFNPYSYTSNHCHPY